MGSLLGSAGVPLSCTPEKAGYGTLPEKSPGYGRTPEEQERDAKLQALKPPFTPDELATIAILCDIILPATPTAGSAAEAGVPEFIDFIVRDIPEHELPMRGGIMWLNWEANRRFKADFKELEPAQQLNTVDDIAYPEREALEPDLLPGIAFFNLMRNLTLTGYYTSQMGIQDLGYQGNSPNTWDGVPAEILAQHEVDYEPEWLAKCVDQSKRFEIAVWDEEGNLLT